MVTIARIQDRGRNPDNFVKIWVGRIPAQNGRTPAYWPESARTAGIRPFWQGFSGQILSAVLARSGQPAGIWPILTNSAVLVRFRPDGWNAMNLVTGIWADQILAKMARFCRRIPVTLT